MTAALQLDWLAEARQARQQGAQGLLADLPRSRASDPDTSHQAAEKVRRTGELGRQQRAVLEAVRTWPGSTSAELGHWIWTTQGGDPTRWRYTVARRLPELSPVHVRRMKPRRCKVTGNPAVTWFPVETSPCTTTTT
jgi:hypothetical protein